MSSKVCVLAYSGGLDTSAMIPYLKENHGVEVVAALIDVGRASGLEMLRQRALDAGALDAVVIDAKDEFCRDFVLPALAGPMTPKISCSRIDRLTSRSATVLP